MIRTTSLGQECRVVTVRGTSEPTLTLKFTLVDSTFTLWKAWLTWVRCSVDKVTFEELPLVGPAVPFAVLEAPPDGLDAPPAVPRVVGAELPVVVPPELPPDGLPAVPLDEVPDFPPEAPPEAPPVVPDAPPEVPPEVPPEAPPVVPDVPPP